MRDAGIYVAVAALALKGLAVGLLAAVAAHAALDTRDHFTWMAIFVACGLWNFGQRLDRE